MAEKNNNQKTVVVLGMARSGTSVVTGVLRILGVDVGIGPTPSKTNPYGSFEDPDFLKLNNEIQKSAGKPYWRDPPSYEKIIAQKEKFDSRIKQLITRKSKDKEIWGWKRHTTSLTIELFLPHLIKPHFIIVFRDPIGGANSIVNHSEGGIDFISALKLMNFYNKETINFLERHPKLPRVFLSFEKLVSEPIREVGRIADFLNLEFTEEKKRQINEFVIPRKKVRFEKRKAILIRALLDKIPGFVKAPIKKMLRRVRIT